MKLVSVILVSVIAAVPTGAGSIASVDRGSIGDPGTAKGGIYVVESRSSSIFDWGTTTQVVIENDPIYKLPQAPCDFKEVQHEDGSSYRLACN